MTEVRLMTMDFIIHTTEFRLMTVKANKHGMSGNDSRCKLRATG